MKATIIPVLLVGALALFSGCRTVPEPRSQHASPDARPQQQRGMARPYYRSNNEGRFYYRTGRETNPDYRPTVRRSRPAGRPY